MLYGDKKVERRGDIVRKPNKILHKNLQFSAASLSLCDKTMRFAKNFAKSAAKKVCSLLLKRQMPCYNECDKEVWNEKILDDTHHDHIGARALRHGLCMRRQHRSEQRGRGRTARNVGHFAAIRRRKDGSGQGRRQGRDQGHDLGRDRRAEHNGAGRRRCAHAGRGARTARAIVRRDGERAGVQGDERHRRKV